MIEQLGYIALIESYLTSCDEGDYYWCDLLRPHIRQAIFDGRP